MRNETQKTSRAISFKPMLAAAFSPFSKLCRVLFKSGNILSVKGTIKIPKEKIDYSKYEMIVPEGKYNFYLKGQEEFSIQRKYSMSLPVGNYEFEIGSHLVEFVEFEVRKFHCYNLQPVNDCVSVNKNGVEFFKFRPLHFYSERFVSCVEHILDALNKFVSVVRGYIVGNRRECNIESPSQRCSPKNSSVNVGENKTWFND